jgi:hypothetical protein
MVKGGIEYIRLTAKLILIMLVLFSTPCFSADRIRSYSDEKGQTVYTNERTGPKNNVINRNLQNSDASYATKGNNDNAQRPDLFNPAASSQPRFNNTDYGNNIIKIFAGILIIPILLFITCFLLWLFALIDVLRHEFTGSNKLIWVLLVCFLPFIGPILYFAIAGRQKIVRDNNYQDPEIASNSRKIYTPPDI